MNGEKNKIVLEQKKTGEPPKSEFVVEKIKERPVNKKKLMRRTAITAAMAVMFGTIACATFLIVQPIIDKWMNPPEKPTQIIFPEDREEMAPEDMLSENNNAEWLISALEHGKLDVTLDGAPIDKEIYKSLYSGLSSYVSELNHSMVVITGVSSNVDWFDNVEESRNQATGVVIANNGNELLVLAEYAPLQKADSMTLSFTYLENMSPGLSRQFPVKMKEKNETTGLAVFSVSLKNLPEGIIGEKGVKIASLGNSNNKNIIGTPVIALGSPMGSKGSVGYGIVTAVTAQTQQADVNYKFLQTDIYGSFFAQGILFDMQGQVIGIISSQKSSPEMKNLISGIGISELKRIVEKMSNKEKIAALGINGIDVTKEANEKEGVPFGAYVREVEMDSPAMRIGIQRGDVIIGMDEITINNYGDYISALMKQKPGSTVELTLMRIAQGGYREIQLRVVLAER